MKDETYIVPFTDFQRFPFPALAEQICDGFIVDLHVAHTQEKLLLWTLDRCKEIKLWFISLILKEKDTDY